MTNKMWYEAINIPLNPVAALLEELYHGGSLRPYARHVMVTVLLGSSPPRALLPYVPMRDTPSYTAQVHRALWAQLTPLYYKRLELVRQGAIVGSL